MSELVWPVVDDLESAKEAAHYAGAWSGVLCALSALSAWIAGLPPGAITICVLYGIAAWRIWAGSQGWAITALVLCILQGIVVLLILPLMWSIALPFAFLALMNGVRATTSLHRLARQPQLH